ncbi:MAG TPA: hypothetical protein VIU86_19930 [Gaiellaceae bacterium]
MTLEEIGTKFATLTAAYAARDADQVTFDAAVAAMNAAIAGELATLIAAQNVARADAHVDDAQTALQTSNAAASDALADYVAAVDEFKNQ